MTLPRGTQLGPYEIATLIGAGGMGEVYRARDTRLDRAVAIKILHGEAGSPERRSRFEREARAIAALTHPHICTVYEVVIFNTGWGKLWGKDDAQYSRINPGLGVAGGSHLEDQQLLIF